MSRLIETVCTAELQQEELIYQLESIGFPPEIVAEIRNLQVCTVAKLQTALHTIPLRTSVCNTIADAIHTRHPELHNVDEDAEARRFGYMQQEPSERIQARIRLIVQLLLRKNKSSSARSIVKDEILIQRTQLLENALINLRTDNEIETFGVDVPWLKRKEGALELVDSMDNIELVESRYDEAKEELRAFEACQDTTYSFSTFIEFIQFCNYEVKQILQPEFKLACKKAADTVTRVIMQKAPKFYRTLEQYALEYIAVNRGSLHTTMKPQQTADFGGEYIFINEDRGNGMVHSINSTDVVSPYLQLYLESKYAHILKEVTITKRDT